MGYHGVVLLLIVVGAATHVFCSDLSVLKLQEPRKNESDYDEQENSNQMEERCVSGEQFVLAECIVCTCGADNLVVNAYPCEQRKCIDYVDPKYHTLKTDIPAARHLPGIFKFPTGKDSTYRRDPGMEDPGISNRFGDHYTDVFAPSMPGQQPVTPDAENLQQIFDLLRRWLAEVQVGGSDPQEVTPNIRTVRLITELLRHLLDNVQDRYPNVISN